MGPKPAVARARSALHQMLEHKRPLSAALLSAGILCGGPSHAQTPASPAPAPAPAAAAPAPAAAAPAVVITDTMKRVGDTRSFLIGVRESSVPFSFLDDKKQAKGYAVDLCLKVADEIKKELKLPKLDVKFVPLASADRIPALLEGRVDIECGSTTNTTERQKQVDFSYTTFVTGARVMARKKDKVLSLADLRGKNVAVTKGTTGEKLVKAENDASAMKLNILVQDNNDASFKAVESGQASAFVTDDILLFGLIAKSAKPADYEVVGKYISIEPYALMIRKDDGRFKGVVNRALQRVYKSGEIQGIYKRWFINSERNIPMSVRLKESIAQPNSSPAYP